MKKYKINIILIIIFLTGLSVMLYPVISDFWNSRVQSQAIVSYDSSVQQMSALDYQKKFQDAESYNEDLKKLDHPFEDYNDVPGYDDILDVSGTGIIGYVKIDRINVELPIYHGTSDGVLQIAAGHLEGSSLPVGGIGTHAVLSAHRGLPSAKLFSDLDKMEEGDTFQITVLNRVLTYQVDQIHIVEPDNLNDLKIDPQKDYCTLMTCTPYGINTHRLLVRGIRVDDNSSAYVPADAYQINAHMVAVFLTVVIAVIWMILVFITRTVKRKTKAVSGRRKDEKSESS